MIYSVAICFISNILILSHLCLWGLSMVIINNSVKCLDESKMDTMLLLLIKSVVKEKILCILKEFPAVQRYVQSKDQKTKSIKLNAKPIYKADYIVISERNIWFIEEKRISKIYDFPRRMYEAIGQLYIYSQLLSKRDEYTVIDPFIEENLKNKEIRKVIFVNLGNVPESRIREKYQGLLGILEKLSIEYRLI